MNHLSLRRYAAPLILMLLTALIVALGAATIRKAQLNRGLVQAVQKDDSAQARLLLAHGADPNLRYAPDSGQPWYDAALSTLFPRRYPPRRHEIPPTLLMMASQLGEADTAKALLDAGADVNARGDYGETALMQAVLANNKEVVHLLLRRGVDVSMKDASGTTAFRMLLLSDNLDFYSAADIALLLGGGAEVNTRDAKGQPALQVAISAHRSAARLDLVKVLLAHGADVNWQASPGDTDIYLLAICPGFNDCSCDDCDPDMARVLIAYGVDVNAIDTDGNTALIRCATDFRPESIQIIKTLLAHHVSINAKGENSATALRVLRWTSAIPDLPYRENYKMIKRLLKQAGAKEEGPVQPPKAKKMR